MSRTFIFLSLFVILSLLYVQSAPVEDESGSDEEPSSFMKMIEVAEGVIGLQNPDMAHLIRKVKTNMEELHLDDVKSRMEAKCSNISWDCLYEMKDIFRDNMHNFYETANLFKDYL